MATCSKLFAVTCLACLASEGVWGSRCGLEVTLPALDESSCLDFSTVLSWLPLNGTLCGSHFDLPLPEVFLELPGLHVVEAMATMQRGSAVWLADDEVQGLKPWAGCGNHPGLVNGSLYCAHTVGVADLSDFLGDFEALEGLTPIACLAYNWELKAISVSFDPQLSTEFILPSFPLVFKLSGFTFAPNSQVPLLDYMGTDLQLRSGESLRTQVALGGIVELAFGIPIICEIVLPLEGIFGMNLGGDQLISPHKVLESMVKADSSSTIGAAIVIQQSMRPELSLLGFSFNFPISVKVQVMWRFTSSSFPKFYLTANLYHATSLSELMGGLPNLGIICDVDFLPAEAPQLFLLADFCFDFALLWSCQSTKQAK